MWMMFGLAASAADTRFVQASTLNLRARPEADAPVRTVLPINAEVDLLSVEAAFAKVRVDGEEGFVAADFLGPEPITVEDALKRAEAAAEPEQRLSWLQRAAAIRPDDEILAALEGGYRDIGDFAAATAISRERNWPRSLMLVATDGLPTLELSQGETPPAGSEGEDPVLAKGVPVAPERFQRRFRFPPNQRGWVLPDRGPAVEAQLVGARLEAVSPCDTGWGTVAYVAAGLPFDREALVFTRSDPPASWRTPSPTPPVPEEVADAAAVARLERFEALPEAPGDETETWILPMPDGWFVRVGRGTSPGLPELARWQVADLHVTATGTEELRAGEHVSFFGNPPEPIAVRDVNGDGALDVVQRDACGRSVTTLTGEPLANTASRCCRY